jgi:hypothetical protein
MFHAHVIITVTNFTSFYLFKVDSSSDSTQQIDNKLHVNTEMYEIHVSSSFRIVFILSNIIVLNT